MRSTVPSIAWRAWVVLFAIGTACLAPSASASWSTSDRAGRIYYGTESGNLRHGAIYSVAPGGGDRQKLPNPTGDPIANPRVDRHGRILFQGLPHDYDFEGVLYRERIDGSHLRRLTAHANVSEATFCGADGRHVVSIEGLRGHVVVIRANGSNQEQVPHTSGASSAVCTPDGKRIVIARDGHADEHWHIEVERLDGSHLRELVTTRRGNSPSELTMAPNGRGVAYDAFRRKPEVHRQIFKLNLYSGHRLRITPHDEFDAIPSYSPNGKSIAFRRGLRRLRHDIVATMRPDGPT